MSSVNSDEVSSAIKLVLAEVDVCARQVSAASLAQAGDMIEAAPRLFVAGSGRSGLVMRAFAARLMHLGRTVNVVGETTTPSITSHDLLIIGSGSGQSPILLQVAEVAKEQGAKILLFTAEVNSPLSERADHCVIIPAPSLKPLLTQRDVTSLQPMGSLFEQTLLILGDSLVFTMMDHLGVGVGKMRKLHANLE